MCLLNSILMSVAVNRDWVASVVGQQSCCIDLYTWHSWTFGCTVCVWNWGMKSWLKSVMFICRPVSLLIPSILENLPLLIYIQRQCSVWLLKVARPLCSEVKSSQGGWWTCSESNIFSRPVINPGRSLLIVAAVLFFWFAAVAVCCGCMDVCVYRCNPVP